MGISEDIIENCQEVMRYRFGQRELLGAALTHASASDQRVNSNERLEFLGDAVLGLVICEELYRRFPDYMEGDMTIVKSAVVSRRTCSQVAEKLDLGRFLTVGRGISERQDLPGSLSAALLEALIGAIYIDGGLEEARSFIVKNFDPFIKLVDDDRYHRDYKSILQQHAHSEYGTVAIYELLDEKGPDHAKAFEIGVSLMIDGRTRTFSPAWGMSKKQAEQKAARTALEELEVLEKILPEADHDAQ